VTAVGIKLEVKLCLLPGGLMWRLVPENASRWSSTGYTVGSSKLSMKRTAHHHSGRGNQN